MSYDRETHELVTPVDGHVVTIKDWINGREKQRIDGIMLRSVEARRRGDNEEAMTMGESLIADQENLRFELLVAAVNGTTEAIVQRIGDMKVKDFEYINKHCERIADGEDFDLKKETSSETITGESSPTEKDESQTLVSP